MTMCSDPIGDERN